MSPAAAASSSSSSSSSRWCPTPEQLMILEELYRSGIRTPSATQIQRITAHLSLYGKIEGKNVFYWFQNHKARDRQKLRRKLFKQLQQQQQFDHHHYQLQQQHQQQIQLSHHHHHLLDYFDSPAATSSAFHPLSYHNSASFLSQGGLEGAPTHLTDYMWNMEIPPQRVKMDNSMMMMRTCGYDWMMMMDVGPPSPCCSSRPLETLQLFPVTSTNLKEECTNNPSPSPHQDHLSCTN